MQSAGRSKTHLLIAKLVLAVCSVALVLVVAEYAIRMLVPQPMSIWDTTRDGQQIHWPGLKTYLHHHDRQLTINSVGMRDREHEVRKPDGVFRIFVLGDSFMEALQVDWEDSLPGLLDRELANEGVEVINGAVSGWSTAKQVTYLERHGLAYEPDLVLLVMTLHNDFHENLLLPFHSVENGRVIANPPEYMPPLRYATLRVKAYMSGHSHLFRLAYLTTQTGARRTGANALDQHVSELFRLSSSPNLQRARDITRQLFERLVDVARDSGSRVAVVLIPIKVQLVDDRLEQFLSVNRIDPSTTDPRQPQRWVNEWAAEANVPVVDLLDPFRSWIANGGAALHVPDGHWGEVGHAAAATETMRQLRSHGLLTSPERAADSPPQK